MTDHSDFKHTFKIDDVTLEPPATTNGLTEGPPASKFQIKESGAEGDVYTLKLKMKVDWNDGTTDIPLDKIDPPDNAGNFFVTHNSINVAQGTSDEFPAHAFIAEHAGADDWPDQQGNGPGVHRIEVTVVPDGFGSQPGGSARGGRD